MDLDDVWRTIDAQRASLADLLDDLSPAEWETPSLCAGWRVRDVAAHLTLAQMGLRPGLVEVVRARGGFDRMIRDSALRVGPLPDGEYGRRIRAMVGSRRRAPFVSPVEPLTDVLVHGQDIAVPLGRERAIPPGPAAVSARRAWAMSFPFGVRKRLAGLQVRATDSDLVLGEGAPVEGTTGDLLLLITGRTATVHRLSGAGVQRLPAAHGRREESRRRTT
ncbi:maleylpyruvate isomerase family mycothiol-dependent enzyme [Geodermatophilus aquaeductus]|uniref:TIGR03083 family protein n=1 Tax=Geodermatophilus aquaeductus TaxID=1564161 RepID=A0A521F7Q8_9ACTN|nr:maleylpyruvate isomerase family mycothiol-dependent enzyme [Geodermatophilus aquaeductus]SMO92126.1 TIGR03083 family protein [Geodermatophilus aquaeductus]